MSPGLNYMLKRARYPDWETEARLRAVKPAGREARSVDGKTAQQRFHFSIWLPLWNEGLKRARESDDHQSTGFVNRSLPVCPTEVPVRMGMNWMIPQDGCQLKSAKDPVQWEI